MDAVNEALLDVPTTLTRRDAGSVNFMQPFALQPFSRLLSIPPEIRLMIYEFVFTPPTSPDAREALALLATCRLISSEATAMAFRRYEFRVVTSSPLSYRSRFSILGSLQQHLRHIDITMDIDRLDTTGGNNPFLLMQLPLNSLRIKFTAPGATDWQGKTTRYYKLVSAFLYFSAIRELGNKTNEIHSSPFLRWKRTIDINTWNFRPRPIVFMSVVLHCQAKEVSLECLTDDNGNDVFWRAFRYFNLLRCPYGKLQIALPREQLQEENRTKTAGFMFYDQAGSSFFRVFVGEESRKVLKTE